MLRHTTRYQAISSRRMDPTVGTARPLVVIPTYEERENIGLIVPAIMEHPAFEVLVVDDNSPDGTADVVRAMMARYPGRVHLIVREGKLGLGTAYIAGFRWALARDYTHVLEMDADFSHHPSTLPRLLQASRHADLVIGSRYVAGGRTVNWPAFRKLISRGGSLYARTVLGLPIQDLTGGFKCFRRHVLEAIDLGSISSAGYAFQIELTWRAAKRGFQIVEIPITFAERQHGASKMSGSIFREAMLKVIELRLQSPRPMLPELEPVAASIRAGTGDRRARGG